MFVWERESVWQTDRQEYIMYVCVCVDHMCVCVSESCNICVGCGWDTDRLTRVYNVCALITYAYVCQKVVVFVCVRERAKKSICNIWLCAFVCERVSVCFFVCSGCMCVCLFVWVFKRASEYIFFIWKFGRISENFVELLLPFLPILISYWGGERHEIYISPQMLFIDSM